MNEILLNNKVIVYFAGELIGFVLLIVALAVAVQIITKWDFDSFLPKQFRLEKRAYLLMSILLFVFASKFILLIYFIFVIDSMALLVPGAMCGAGVISANDYGMTLLFVKLIILFLMLLWISLNRYDLEAKTYPVIKGKMWLYVAIFGSVLLEAGLEAAYFLNIDIHRPVSCCSALFGQLEGANPLPFGLDITKMIILYYLLYMVLAGSLLGSQKVVALISALLFVIIAYYSVVYFFGTYIYELPTHKCPFCMMQREYYYVGYIVWGTLFIGISLALIWAIMGILFGQERKKEKSTALWLLSIFVLICSSYVGLYYIKNGVLL